ncbi:MAG: bifunctional metallophosphatase/5'-nucleotidase [Clostridia bacterium]|nr:bifunctional metallophosphatase/5'-nucleotidase [Clostridia bacterium]
MGKRLPILSLSIFFAFAGCGATGNTSGSSDGQVDGVHVHADADTDGLCDGCGASIRAQIDFYAINDLHGKFDDTYANIGVDEMTSYLRNAQATKGNTVVLSTGDMWQGSAESNFTKGRIITDWMNDLGFESMTMGNHEFDWGEAYIEANESLAEFPFLGINVYDRATNERVDYCEPSVMVERSGVKIGIIGAIGDCYSSIAEEQVEDICFKVGDELTALVKAESDRLRALGADMIVYSLHDAEASNIRHYDLGLSNGYVDLVFEGHSHTTVCEKDAYGVWHLQAGGDNAKGISYAQVSVNIITDEVSVNTAKLVYHSAYAGMEDDPIVDELLNKYGEELTQVNEVLGQNSAYRNSKALANATAKALYLAGEARWGGDEKYKGKIVLGGGYINVRSPYYLPVGQVSYGDIYPLFPFDNPIVLCTVTGSRLKSQFIDSNNYYVYYGEDGEAVKNDLDYNETYYVVVDTYCANYNFRGMGFLPIAEYYDEAHEVFTRDALAAYIRNGGLDSLAI